jgi:uncharacterized phage-like protein YoqJ
MKEQLAIEKTEYTACVFTGHRELKSGFSVEEVRKAIATRLEQGVKVFYNGMACGFDLVSADELLKFRKDYDFKLIACIPCPKQSRSYTLKEKAKYNEILENADEVVLVNDHYFNGCFLVRNDYMIERSDCMIAYLTEDKGGTAYTVRKFRKNKGEDILFVNKG